MTSEYTDQRTPPGATRTRATRRNRPQAVDAGATFTGAVAEFTPRDAHSATKAYVVRAGERAGGELTPDYTTAQRLAHIGRSCPSGRSRADGAEITADSLLLRR